MPTYEFLCPRCSTMFDEFHSMRNIPNTAECPECKTASPRQFAAPAFSTRGDDLLDGGKPQYCPALARKMPYGKDDPKAFFSSKKAAREAARRKADTGDYQLTFD